MQFEYIRTEAVPKNGLSATLFHLAERGLVELHQVGRGSGRCTAAVRRVPGGRWTR